MTRNAEGRVDGYMSFEYLPATNTVFVCYVAIARPKPSPKANTAVSSDSYGLYSQAGGSGFRDKSNTPNKLAPGKLAELFKAMLEIGNQCAKDNGHKGLAFVFGECEPAVKREHLQPLRDLNKKARNDRLSQEAIIDSVGSMLNQAKEELHPLKTGKAPRAAIKEQEHVVAMYQNVLDSVSKYSKGSQGFRDYCSIRALSRNVKYLTDGGLRLQIFSRYGVFGIDSVNYTQPGEAGMAEMRLVPIFARVDGRLDGEPTITKAEIIAICDDVWKNSYGVRGSKLGVYRTRLADSLSQIQGETLVTGLTDFWA